MRQKQVYQKDGPEGFQRAIGKPFGRARRRETLMMQGGMMMKILNYGSMNIDHVYAVPRMVTPGETLIAEDKQLFCGGKGLNQSVAIARAGGRVFHAGVVGEDGGMLCDALTDAGVDIRHVRRRAGASCETVIQVDAHGQNSIIVYNNPALRLQ